MTVAETALRITEKIVITIQACKDAILTVPPKQDLIVLHQIIKDQLIVFQPILVEMDLSSGLNFAMMQI